MSEYAVIYEQGPTSWGAWVPDLPGCVAAGESRGEVKQLIAEAIEAHIESLREQGEPVPEPSSTTGVVQVPSRLSGRPGASDPLPRASIYGVLYIEDGNFLNWYDRRDDAERDVLLSSRIVPKPPSSATSPTTTPASWSVASSLALISSPSTARPPNRRPA